MKFVWKKIIRINIMHSFLRDLDQILNFAKSSDLAFWMGRRNCWKRQWNVIKRSFSWWTGGKFWFKIGEKKDFFRRKSQQGVKRRMNQLILQLPNSGFAKKYFTRFESCIATQRFRFIQIFALKNFQIPNLEALQSF